MPTDKKLTVKKKLKVKLSRSADDGVEFKHERPGLTFSSVDMITPRNSQNVPISGSCVFNRQSSFISVSMTTFGQEHKAATTARLIKDVKNHSSNEKEVFLVGNCKEESSVRCAGKRGPERSLCSQKVKKPKMGNRTMQECRALLKKLMNHQYGFVFNQPVDPMALQIPDYFDIISEPMDLGTIKEKLENEVYLSTSEFAADVRLTFSNAMKYNPPTNWVHELACELNRIFTLGWKSLEAKWSEGKSDAVHVDEAPISEGRSSKAAHVKELCPKSAASSDTLPMLSLQFAPKQQLKKNLMEISKRKLPLKLQGHLRRLGLLREKEDKTDLKFNNFDEETARELQIVIRSYLKSNVGKFANTGGACGRDSSLKDPHRGSYNSNNHKCDPVTSKSLGNPAASPKGSFGDMKSRSSHPNDFTEALSGSDIDSEHSSGEEIYHACQGKMLNMEASTNGSDKWQTTSSDLYFAEYLNTTYDGQLSPSKALRAAMLRSRFADTILKAQHKTLLSTGERIDLLKVKQERERFGKKQREEKARIEAHIKAAETASQNKKEAELKLLRQRQRQAARQALQEMEKSVEIYDNLALMKDIEMMGKCFGNGKVLERLGLFLKNDCPEDDDELMNVEEGEIVC